VAPLIVLALNVIVLCFQEEAPKFLHGVKNYDKTRHVLTRIGRDNGVLEDDQYFTSIFEQEKVQMNNKQSVASVEELEE